MFKSFFNLFKEEEDDTPETIVEKRRQEKVSDVTSPVEPQAKPKPKALVPEDVIVEKPTPKPDPVKVDPKPKARTVAAKEPQVEEYHMSQVISPIFGARKDKNAPHEATPAKKKRKVAHSEDGLISVFSPFYVPVEDEPEVEITPAPEVTEAIVAAEPTVTVEAEEPVIEAKVETVEDNIRNIAKLIDDTDADLKIIEERTGEFRLDFKDAKAPDGRSSQEIKDDTSLEELMNLYDKFKN